MTAINFVNAQIEAEESPLPFESRGEADKLGLSRSLRELKTQYETRGKLDLGHAFDKLTRVFRVREETTVVTIIEDDTLHSAHTAQTQPQRTRKFGQKRNDNVKRSPPP